MLVEVLNIDEPFRSHERDVWAADRVGIALYQKAGFGGESLA